MTLTTRQGFPPITAETSRVLAFTIVVVAALALKVVAYVLIHDQGTLAYHILSVVIRVAIYVACCALPALVVALLMKNKTRAFAATFAIAFILACSIDVAASVSKAVAFRAATNAWTTVSKTYLGEPISAEYTIDGNIHTTDEATKIEFSGDTIRVYKGKYVVPTSVISGASSISIHEWTTEKTESQYEFVHIGFTYAGGRAFIPNSQKIRRCGGTLKLYKNYYDDDSKPQVTFEGVSDVGVMKGPRQEKPPDIPVTYERPPDIPVSKGGFWVPPPPVSKGFKVGLPPDAPDTIELAKRTKAILNLLENTAAPLSIGEIASAMLLKQDDVRICLKRLQEIDLVVHVYDTYDDIH